jgi:hypothetical protein
MLLTTEVVATLNIPKMGAELHFNGVRLRRTPLKCDFFLLLG